MSRKATRSTSGLRPRARGAIAAALMVGVLVAAFGGAGGAAAQSTAQPKLLIGLMSFPCGLNDFAHSLCAGFADGAKQLPKGYTFKLKTAVDFSDTVAYNNLIQTSLQLQPSGLLVFPNGPSGVVPVLKQACAKSIRIIVLDNAVTGLGKCQNGFIAANHYQLGVNDAKWLIAHPPATKEVAIVSFPKGQNATLDDAVRGFTTTVTKAGYKIVATVNASLDLDTTRTGVTNALTAHPNLGAVFSTNDTMGDASAQALSGHASIAQLTLDGSLSSVKRLAAGQIGADGTQDPYFLGKQSVLNMVKLLQGKKVKSLIYEPSMLVDKTNAKSYIAAGGMR